ncbi:hypothetical protein EG68_01625 [Paragonimus skrjabini miyazakii]|uniref:Reverse transcriptase domain-containing protein n=1 Tax=Paragonimus skrjabini miyazakii TaxID=59628 RepID=A0A8S9Z0A7_9TREM|nr:hypothetical protein EG68_01625 [Paragonimus skrjabini miyazakii]
MEDILKGALEEYIGPGVELLPDARLTDLEYADYLALLSPSAEDVHTMLDKASDRAGLYGIRFTPSKCNVASRLGHFHSYFIAARKAFRSSGLHANSPFVNKWEWSSRRRRVLRRREDLRLFCAALFG